MVSPRFPILLGLLVVTICVLTPNLSAQGTNTFQISIPKKVACGITPSAPPLQIMVVKATVMVDPVAPFTRTDSVSFTITDLQGNPWNPTLSLGGTANHTFPVPAQSSCPPTGGDIAVIHAPASADDNRYEIDFHLLANYAVGNSCMSTQAPARDPDKFTVQVDANHKMIGVCLQSFDTVQRPGTAFSCTSNNIFAVPLTESVASVVGLPIEACGTQRPGVDAILVLDKSGSMAASTAAAVNPEPKIQALQSAVGKFVSAWDTIRTQEAMQTPPVNNPDNIGVVLFDHDANWWTDGGLSSGLNVFGGPTGADTKIQSNLNGTNCPNPISNCGQLVPGTSTSIGGGLVKADAQFGITADANRKAILLMSDGIQNTDPMVRPCDPNDPNNPNPTNPTAIGTYSLATPNVNTSCPLANERTSNYRIYAVTVGTGMAVSAAVNQGIAAAAGGFYINTEDNPNLLGPFFTELLQNFLRFNSYETVRLISKIASPTAPYSTSLPISTTSQNVEFMVMWPNGQGALRLTVTPPGGAPPVVKEASSGFISITQTLPLPAPFDPLGDWKVLVEVPTAVGVERATTGTAGEVPFDLHVMTDDAGIKSELSVVPRDYKAGDKIRLRAKLTRFGLPILGVGSYPGDKIEVHLIRPGKSIGDLLSDSTASAVPSGPDPQSAAEAKLDNTLNSVPSPLVFLPETIQLFDDGKAEHGDDVAGDGIYSGFFQSTQPGHYHFAFGIETVDPRAVRFSRQQLVTAYARAVPDAGNTVFQTSIARRENRNVLSIVMTPRVKPRPGCLKNDPKCGRMGPGWANYFWFTSPGVDSFKAKDNLDGTYTASLVFTGAFPPPVSVGFEDVLTIIDDSVTFGNLPAKPTSLVDHIPGPPMPSKWAVFIDAGAGIPHGTFGNFFNTGFSLNAGLEYMVTSHFSAEGIFGYHHFPANVGSSLDVYQFSGNGKFYLTSSGPIRPFVNGGIGGYKFSPGSTYFGGNFGVGVLREFGPHWGLQASYNFHAVNTPVTATKFSTIQGGIRFAF